MAMRFPRRMTTVAAFTLGIHLVSPSATCGLRILLPAGRNGDTILLRRQAAVGGNRAAHLLSYGSAT
jgi:hypothetical protein